MAKKFFTTESFNTLVTEFKKYADAAANKVKNDLLNGAGGAYDTLKELGDLIDDNQDTIDALETVAASKADKAAVAYIDENDNDAIDMNISGGSANTDCLVLNGKNVIMIGDSYSMGSGGITNQGWCYYLQEISNCNAAIAQASSGGFIAKASSGIYKGKKFGEILQTIYNNLTEVQKSNIDYIVTCGGINDIAQGTTDEISQAVIEYCELALSLFPKTKLYVVPLYSDATFGEFYYDSNDTKVTVHNGVLKYNGLHAIYDSAITHGACSTPNSIFWLLGRVELGSGDGIHPNDAGYREIGTRLASFISCGESSYVPSVITTANVTDAEAISFKATIKNDLTTLSGEIRLTNPYKYKPFLALPQAYCPTKIVHFPALLSNGTDWEFGTIVFDVNERSFQLNKMPSFSISSGSFVRIVFHLSYVRGL